jgi:TPR repeat protein
MRTNKEIIGPLAKANKLSDIPDFNDATKLGSGKEMVVKWYRKAAEQGHATAQCNLGVSYSHGIGVPENDTGAYAWFSVAATSGNEKYRDARDLTKRNLTPTQVERGQALARDIFERIRKQKE